MNTTIRNSLLILSLAALYFFTRNCTNIFGLTQNIEVPDVAVGVDLKNGFKLRPYNVPANTDKVLYRLIEQPNSQEISGELDFTPPDEVEPLEVIVPWTDEEAEVEFCYVDSRGDTILCHTVRVGDGVILDDPVVIYREDDGSPNLCGLNCTKEYEIESSYQVSLENIKEKNIYRITIAENLVLIVATTDKGVVVLEKCGKAANLAERNLQKAGMEFSGGGNAFILKAFNSDDKLKIQIIDNNPNGEHTITSACLLN